jgi:prepilin-type N-terminal cleavage/methylation domain-containing protein
MEHPMSARTRSFQTPRAFTLLELLVAMAILSIFVVLALRLASDSLAQWERGNSQLKTNLQARLVMEWIERDLQTALVRQDGGEWLRWEPEELALPAGFPVPVGKLMLFSQAGELHPDPDNPGEQNLLSGLAAVAYDVDYTDPLLPPGAGGTASRDRLGIYRLALDPAYTFERGFVEATPANLQTDFWNVLPPDIGVVLPEHLLIENVAGFRVVLEFVDGDGATLRTEATETISVGVDGDLRIGAGSGAVTHPAARVLSAEITLWILDSRGANLLRPGNTPAGMTRADLFARHAYAFTKKIPLPSP